MPALHPASYALQSGSPATPSKVSKLRPSASIVRQQAARHWELPLLMILGFRQFSCSLPELPVRRRKMLSSFRLLLVVETIPGQLGTYRGLSPASQATRVAM